MTTKARAANDVDTIVKHYMRLQICDADRDEVRQLAAIAQWEAETRDDGRGARERFVRSKVSWGIKNGMRSWLQTAKACKPRHLEYYSTISDLVGTDEP